MQRCLLVHYKSEFSHFAIVFKSMKYGQEFAIALAENAVDNGVELRIRREVEDMTYGKCEEAGNKDVFTVKIRHWEPEAYVHSLSRSQSPILWLGVGAVGLVGFSLLVWLTSASAHYPGDPVHNMVTGASVLCWLIAAFGSYHLSGQSTSSGAGGSSTIVQLVDDAGPPIGKGKDGKVEVADMLVGGSGSSGVQHGVTVETETTRAKYVINCAGGASDKIANMIGDNSFKIKPRLGDYLLMHRNQVSVISRFDGSSSRDLNCLACR